MAESSQLTSHKKRINKTMLVSYDVKSLFTSIPVNESIDLCEQRLLDDDSLAKLKIIGRDT